MDPMLPHGRNFCKCAACGEYFRNVKAFERHRVGGYAPVLDRRCTATPDMAERGLEQDSKGYWRLPKREFPKL